MKKSVLLSLSMALSFIAVAQSNIFSTSPVVEQVMLGNYDPGQYTPSSIPGGPDEIVDAIMNGISPDSLKSYLMVLSSFETRNTGSDTVSLTTGIGAARRWIYDRFSQIGTENSGRLIPSYLQFDQDICGMGQHRNVFAVLPGLDVNAEGMILIEAHMDSRNKENCNTTDTAHGMEDNGSGTALVIELARVMSKLAFDHTIVFMATTGEEQGLLGANAFAMYAVDKGIGIKAVLNNDIVGGIICGETSSAPSCPGLNHVDSTQVRLFSQGGFSSKHKQLARFIKLQYEEELKPLAAVPMLLTVMTQEDRSGRGGDHIPFRQNGFPAIRFTSANEHGDAGVSDPDYHDRQHTVDDILGVDTDGDNVLDSFFVDFNYLSRNAMINGVAAGMAAIGPVTPAFETSRWDDQFFVEIEDPFDYGEYRVFLRSQDNDFDTIYTVYEKSVALPKPASGFVVSVASVDEDGIESLFTGEELPLTVNEAGEVIEKQEQYVELLQNRPNPFDEATMISFRVHRLPDYREAYVIISDMSGQEIMRYPVQLREGINEIIYRHGYNQTGVFAYSLVIDGKVMDTKRMIFAN